MHFVGHWRLGNFLLSYAYHTTRINDKVMDYFRGHVITADLGDYESGPVRESTGRKIPDNRRALAASMVDRLLIFLSYSHFIRRLGIHTPQPVSQFT